MKICQKNIKNENDRQSGFKKRKIKEISFLFFLFLHDFLYYDILIQMHISSRENLERFNQFNFQKFIQKQTDQIKLIEEFDQTEIRNQLCMESSPALPFCLPILAQCDQIVLINLLSEIYQTQRFTLFQVY